MNVRRTSTAATVLRHRLRDDRPREGTRHAAPAAGSRVIADPPQDRALYTCVCGYVFAATVTTSVDCPHCGDAQAW